MTLSRVLAQRTIARGASDTASIERLAQSVLVNDRAAPNAAGHSASTRLSADTQLRARLV